MYLSNGNTSAVWKLLNELIPNNIKKFHNISKEGIMTKAEDFHHFINIGNKPSKNQRYVL